MKKFTAIIVAAGLGTRFKSKISKQFLTIKDKPILVYSLEKFLKLNFSEIILVLHKDSIPYYEENIKPFYNLDTIKVVIGGNNRASSVYNALKSITKTDVVLIHDAVRPLISLELIEKVMQSTKEHGGCIPCIKLKDTIKKVTNNFVVETINREEYMAAQTPQGFYFDELLKAYDAFEIDNITDEATLYEMLNKKIHVVEGEYSNIKITTKEDLNFALATLQNELI